LKDLFIRIARKRSSYDYKHDMKAKDDWLNNDNNNMRDSLLLFYNEALLLKVKCQSVSNIPGGRFTDTIKPGKFQLKCFVENRNFYGRIHGIINCYDLDGQFINSKSITPIVGENGAPANDLRTLLHDTQSLKPKPPMTLTRAAWSASCIILFPSDLEALNKIFDSYKIISGDIINGEIVEEDDGKNKKVLVERI
jgi:hypothetical protein